MRPALIIEFEDREEPITFTRAQLRELLNVPDPEIQGDTGGDYRCKVCGVPMVETYSEGKFVNSSLETSRWETYHGIQAMSGFPRDCIIYNDVFGWQQHEPEEV